MTVHRSGKTRIEATMYRPGVDRKKQIDNPLLKATGRNDPSDFGETRTVGRPNPDLALRLIACRDDRRILRTDENTALLKALILEAHNAGWQNCDIAHRLWTSTSNVRVHLLKMGAIV